MTKEEKTVDLLVKMIESWGVKPLKESELGDLSRLTEDGTSFRFKGKEYLLCWGGTRENHLKAVVYVAYKINKEDDKANICTLATDDIVVVCVTPPSYITGTGWKARNKYAAPLEKALKKSAKLRKFVSILQTESYYLLNSEETDEALKNYKKENGLV